MKYLWINDKLFIFVDIALQACCYLTQCVAVADASSFVLNLATVYEISPRSTVRKVQKTSVVSNIVI